VHDGGLYKLKRTHPMETQSGSRLEQPEGALAYLNGRLIPESEARLPVFDAGVVMGATVTEMVRTFHHRAYRLADHLARLCRSLDCARLTIGLGQDELGKTAVDLVAHNARLLETDDELCLIVFVTAGGVRTYARMAGAAAWNGPTVCLHTFPLPFELYARKMHDGAHLVTPTIRQMPGQCVPSYVKCRSRMHYYLADKEVQLVAADASALLLDLEGHVTETNAANFLMVADGSIISPPATKTLPGVSRDTVRHLSQGLGIPFIEAEIDVASALKAKEAFLSSTPCCLMPVTRINDIVIGTGRPGPIFKNLIDAWNQEVGLDIMKQMQIWRMRASHLV
jgi:branched-subunit amino acid aminotransferase/4-amino-4-deoxychorismate lyase